MVPRASSARRCRSRVGWDWLEWSRFCCDGASGEEGLVVVLGHGGQVVEVDDSVVGEVAVQPREVVARGVVVLGEAGEVGEVDGPIEVGVAQEGEGDQYGRGVDPEAAEDAVPAAEEFARVDVSDAGGGVGEGEGAADAGLLPVALVAGAEGVDDLVSDEGEDFLVAVVIDDEGAVGEVEVGAGRAGGVAGEHVEPLDQEGGVAGPDDGGAAGAENQVPDLGNGCEELDGGEAFL